MAVFVKNPERFMKALANRRRIEIVRYLSIKKRATVGQLAGHIKLSYKSTSKHISVLKSAEIIDGEQVNLSGYYSLTDISHPIIKYLINN